MALWDALSGKVLAWNRMMMDANGLVCRGLKTYCTSFVPKSPEEQAYLPLTRYALYAYYLGATRFFCDNLEGVLSPYKTRLLGLNARSYLCLVCAQHAKHAVIMYVSKKDASDKDSAWFLLQMQGICAMYGRTDGYLADWLGRLDWFADDQHGTARMAVKAYEEIASVLGLTPINPIEALIWGQHGVSIAHWMRSFYDHPAWRKAVDVEMNAH